MEKTTESSWGADLILRMWPLRWLLLFGELLATILLPRLLELSVPLVPMLIVVVLHAGFNLLLVWRLLPPRQRGEADLVLQFCADLVALGALLFLTGGAANPLISLLLPPVAIAALTLSRRNLLLIAGLAVTLYSLLMVWYLPLAVSDPLRATQLHLAGMWLTFVVSTLLMAWLLAYLVGQLHDRETRLAAIREQALRDEQVLSLGTLAAGAAHELGTPLATMSLLAEELAEDLAARLPDAGAMQQDLALLQQQIRLCKDIISGLASRGGVARLERAATLPGEVWLAQQLARWQAMRPRGSYRLQPGAGPLPRILPPPVLEQALLNLLNNAANASGDQEISVTAGVDGDVLQLDIRDQGPGFSPEVLALAGKQALPSRQGLGMGLLLTGSSMAQLGGSLSLCNLPGGGGQASLRLPLARLQV
ncbi:MAG: hypothetical protein RIR00_2128 [Pseudomonadota bacterium]|jgi:two-component system sensor histidine kinase RegB